jgi:hypothetical protein
MCVQRDLPESELGIRPGLQNRGEGSALGLGLPPNERLRFPPKRRIKSEGTGGLLQENG